MVWTMASGGTALSDRPPFGGAGAGAPDSVAVVYERGSAGAAVLREAAELASAGHQLSVVTLVPQARPPRWGRAGGEGPYNIAVREEGALELREAREILGSSASRATFEVLAACPLPPLVAWVAHGGFTVVLLPYRRFSLGGNPFARSLRRKTLADVRIVR